MCLHPDEKIGNLIPKMNIIILVDKIRNILNNSKKCMAIKKYVETQFKPDIKFNSLIN